MNTEVQIIVRSHGCLAAKAVGEGTLTKDASTIAAATNHLMRLSITSANFMFDHIVGVIGALPWKDSNLQPLD